MLSETNYRTDLQALRGIAVLAVVLFHAKASYFPLGYLGVDAFFVISGFVVTPLILRIFTDRETGVRLSQGLRSFYKRRFYRLAPALASTLCVSAAIVFLFGPPGDHQNFAKQGIATLLFAGNYGAFKYSGDYFLHNPNALIHTWSLSLEEQIYLFLPAFMILMIHNRSRVKKSMALVLGFISLASFISFMFSSFLPPLYFGEGIKSAYQFSFYSPIDRLWQFTLGGLCFFLQNRYKCINWKIAKWLHLLAVTALAIIMFSPMSINLKISSILATLLTLIVISFKSIDILPVHLNQIFEWLGDRSYSIYLVHMPLLYIAKYSTVVRIGNDDNRIIQSTIAVIASILLGALSYSKIENRFRAISKDNRLSGKTIAVSLLLAIAIPLALFSLMDFGSKKQYWGLDRNISKPPYAGSLDVKCLRASRVGLPCFYTNIGATNTVLLLGDSHAGQISQAVVSAAVNVNWNAIVWVNSSCQVQLQINNTADVLDSCTDANSKIKTWVLENKPEVIIISEFVRIETSQFDLRNNLRMLKSLVKNVLLIENNPVFPDERDFMVARPIVLSPYNPPRSFTVSEMNNRDVESSDKLANWARRNGILTMNFNSLYCNKEFCNRFVGSDWLYLDDDHLSVAGARLTIPKLTNFLIKF